MKFFIVCSLLLATISLVNPFGFFRTPFFKRNHALTPTEIFGMKSEQLSQLSLSVLVDILNDVCSKLELFENMHDYNIDVSKLELILITASDNVTVTLNEINKLWESKQFNQTAKIVLFIHGFQPYHKEPTYTIGHMVAKAYLNRSDANFIFLNTAQYIHTLYNWAAFNTELIGLHLGDALASIKEKHYIRNMHILGFSLGAQIAGAAARRFSNTTGTKLPYITGLDPARPCFKNRLKSFSIDKTDAEFIDIIHADNDALGSRKPMGDVDFYPNGLTMLQPGCNTLGCSHERSYMYYVETVYPNHENDFPATKCATFKDLENKNCKGDKIMMGYAVPRNACGVYYLSTRSSYPYGENTK